MIPQGGSFASSRSVTSARRRAGLPWWVIVLAVIVTILAMMLGGPIAWADHGEGAPQDDIPIWVMAVFILGSVVGVHSLASSSKR